MLIATVSFQECKKNKSREFFEVLMALSESLAIRIAINKVDAIILSTLRKMTIATNLNEI